MAMIIAIMDTKLASSHNALLSKLVLKQGSKSDYAFAEELRINRSLWQLTRTGVLPIGFTLLKAVVRLYKDLHEDVLNFMKDSTGEDHDHNSNTIT